MFPAAQRAPGRCGHDWGVNPVEDVPEAASLCQKNFPNIAQLITVPCGE
jgi:hypothetical protein